MSLGLYLWAIGIGLVTRSTYLTLAAGLVAIPAHVFYLKYFEEYELELRMGSPYIEYKREVPFLLPRFPGRRS
jgi:protein-S-isoprenylcysteine O-methyltransferase Ste14